MRLPIHLLLALLALFTSPAHAVDLAFTLNGDTSGSDPVLYMDLGQQTTIDIWAKTSGTTGYVNQLNFSIRGQSIAGGNIAGSFGPIYITLGNVSADGINPGDPVYFKWDNFGIFGGYDINGLRVYDVDAYANSFRPGLSPQADWQPEAYFTFIATHEGTYQLFFQDGDLGGTTETSGITTNHFGFDDDAVPNVAGAESSLPDLTVIIPQPPLPEPSCIGLLALGFLAVRIRSFA
ncbi:MAG TPA: hypothetical protein VFE58_00045 [Tepidisphaeraceae bacterium]|jgi:hypothetical protein|nr:hypothetical protein [Tepidisphaeraceae bacterium]